MCEVGERERERSGRDRISVCVSDRGGERDGECVWRFCLFGWRGQNSEVRTRLLTKLIEICFATQGPFFRHLFQERSRQYSKQVQ